jgi:hypothetical protein
MKKLLLLLLVLLHGVTSQAQLTTKKFHLNTEANIGKIDTAMYYGGSLNFEWNILKNISIQYNFDYLERNDQIRQFHTPLGAIGGPIWIAASSKSLIDGDSTTTGIGILYGLLVLALPDGVSYHIPVSNRWQISPYANILGIDFVKNRNDETKSDIKYSCSFGVKGMTVFNNTISTSIFLETRKTAGMGWGFGGGFGFGYLFGKHKKYK